LYDFKGFQGDNKGYEGLFDMQDVAMQRPCEQDVSQKRQAQLMRGNKYDKALYRPWDLPQSRNMNVMYAAWYSPQPNS
jgi:hypothetical protein